MAYCTADNVRAHAKQAPASETFAAYIDAATAVIESALRGIFALPLSPADDPMLADIAARLAAGLWARATYSASTMTETDYAGKLIKEARADLESVRVDPARLTCEVADAASSEERSTILVSDGGDPAFTLGDPRTWSDES